MAAYEGYLDEMAGRVERHQEYPDALYTPLAAVIIPLVQSVITSVLWALLARALLAVFRVRGEDAWYLTFLCFVAVLAVVWTQLWRRWLKITQPVQFMEQMLDRDLDGDGEIGQALVTRIQLVDADRQHSTFANLPASREQLERLARGILAGVPFSENSWTGAGQPFSRAAFRALRTEFLARGMVTQASDKSRQLGYQFTPAGRAVLRYFASGEQAQP